MRLSTEAAPAGGLAIADADADATDIGRILRHSAREAVLGAGTLPAVLGLPGNEIALLRDRYVPGLALNDLDLPLPPPPEDQQAIGLLILMRAGQRSDTAAWLAAILARRALEPRHLWEDLGLASRPALSALIGRHLPGLKAANRHNMRWKKFFYRQICSDAAFSLCLSPSCEACDERADCFAPD
ncbi:MAG: nitrogen fixation protein NifQ [Pseudomonadota bacterium]